DVYAVVFSPRGDLLASGSADRTVKLWEPRTGKVLQTLKGQHTDIVRAVAFAPDQKTLASASVDRTVRLWDLATGTTTHTLTGHTGRVESLEFSPDGKTLATGGGGGDTSIKLWDLTKE